MNDEVLATVSVSAPRRWSGITMLSLLGGLLVYVAIATPPELAWQAFLLVTGAVALWVADKTRRATERGIELTRQGLRDTSGEVIAPIEHIVAIERGVFAMKPSNGFLVRLNQKRARRWLPGLWWAVGRKIGVGGVTAASQTKMMAQMLEALIHERDQASDHTT